MYFINVHSLYLQKFNTAMLKAGLVGAGHLGKIHLRLLNQSDKYEFVETIYR